MTTPGAINKARSEFHARLLGGVLGTDKKGMPSNADSSNRSSQVLAAGILQRLSGSGTRERLAAQTSGNEFESACEEFLQATFGELLGHLRPGNWDIRRVHQGTRLAIATFQQYKHLSDLEALARANAMLRAAIGGDYAITPDIIIARQPEPDEVINSHALVVDDASSKAASLRRSVSTLPLLHASISCKWTLRSDRAQNARSEALNLVKNRKGHLPHVVVILGEPLPSRIASIALGTGEIDCVYHFALYELLEAAEELGSDDTTELLRIMIDGGRLKDISDLPLDLAV